MTWGNYFVFVLLSWLLLPVTFYLFLMVSREMLVTNGLRWFIALYFVALFPGVNIFMTAAGMLLSVVMGVILLFRILLISKWIKLDAIVDWLNARFFKKNYRRGW